MIQAVRGEQNPMVVVRTRLPEGAPATGTIHVDLGSPVRRPDSAVQANQSRTKYPIAWK
jgi:hypothetical protein